MQLTRIVCLQFTDRKKLEITLNTDKFARVRVLPAEDWAPEVEVQNEIQEWEFYAIHAQGSARS